MTEPTTKDPFAAFELTSHFLGLAAAFHDGLREQGTPSDIADSMTEQFMGFCYQTMTLQTVDKLLTDHPEATRQGWLTKLLGGES